jgi:hypothetical protein
MSNETGLADRTLRWARRALGPYFRDLSALGTASSVSELRQWFQGRETAGFGFNGDILRTAIVRAAFEAAGCSVFLETGTFRAATTLLAARLLRCPVYTSELNAKYWLLAVARCAPVASVHPRHADSRDFLAAMARELPRSIVPFVYLDAHWNQDLPLQAEVDIVFSTWPRFVMLIDDFQVPGKPGFAFDSYAGRPLSLATVRFPFERLAAPSGLFFPAYAPEEDTGNRRGYVLVAGGLRERFTAARRFPLTLLQEHSDMGAAAIAERGPMADGARD